MGLVSGHPARPPQKRLRLNEWIDPDTGHHVVRLSREGGTASLYCHQNAYSADGRKLVVTNPSGIATIDLATRTIDQVVTGRVSVLVTGRRSGDIYYMHGATHIYAVEVNRGDPRNSSKKSEAQISNLRAYWGQCVSPLADA